MKTTYASGKAFVAPVITTTTGGTVQGTGNYYFWLKGKNRAGYSAVSPALTLNIATNRVVTVSSSNYTVATYSSWFSIVLYCSKTNDFTTSRAIHRYLVRAEDQVTINTPSNISLSNNALNLASTITDPSLLPTDVPNGFRVTINSLSFTYEYDSSSTEVADDLYILNPVSGAGRWKIVDALYDADTSSDTELYLLNSTLTAPLENLNQTPVPVRYYLINDGASSLSGYIHLNPYISSDTKYDFSIKVLGYLNSTYSTLDTTGTGYSSYTPYTTPLPLGKALPVNSALVLEVLPVLNDTELSNTQIHLYPKITSYSEGESINYFKAPVADLTTLKAITTYIDLETRYVASTKSLYTYNASSTAADNGSSIIIPNSNPTSGRWLSVGAAVASDSVGLSSLKQEVIDALDDDTKVTTITLANSNPYTLNFDTNYDYFIVNAPVDSGSTLTIDVSATLANNQIKTAVLELRQNTAPIAFHASITFPGGTTPVLSGNSKIDMIVLTIIKDGAGVVKKRGILSHKDIG